ncbi:MAG: LysR family transcriptional regulator [Burkholderiales bacterium]|nr:LysR family transcriptional regulator [Burkholderiales bacterium]
MHFKRIDLNLVPVFDALMRERNVTRAAQRLFLSQPAVSHALARLRTSLADPLFVRDGRDMVPTPRAIELAAVLGPLLQGFDVALRSEFSPATISQTFRLALPDIAELVLAPRLIPILRREAPQAKIAFVELDLDHFQDQLARGDLDAAILPSIPLRPMFHRRTVAREAGVVGLVRPGHPDASAPLTAAHFRRMPRLAVTLSGKRVASPVEESSRLERQFGEVQVSTAHMIATAATLLHSDLILVLGELAGRTLAAIFGLKVLQLPIKMPAVDSMLAWHERTHRDLAQRWLRDAVIRALSEFTQEIIQPPPMARQAGARHRRSPVPAASARPPAAKPRL